MRGAPPVAVVCDGGTVWRGVQAGLPALAMAALVAWAVGHAGFDTSGQALAALPAAWLAAGLAWRAAAPQPRALAWDGEQWRLGPIDDAGRVEVMLDLGGWLLLRHASHGAGAPTTWLPVSATSAGAALHGLRVALQASQRTAPAGMASPERQAR